MKRLSWKYLAGLTDGEGCVDFQIHTKKGGRIYMVPRLRIAMSDNSLFVLEMIKANHGGNIWASKLSHRNPNWQDASYWQIQGKKMRAFLQNIIKHMYIKKEQAKFALWWVDNVMGKELNNCLQTVEGNIIKQFARDELKAMKVDPQRLSEVAVKKLRALGFGLWSPHSNKCIDCGTTERRHEGNGYCDRCYNRRKYHNLHRCDSPTLNLVCLSYK